MKTRSLFLSWVSAAVCAAGLQASALPSGLGPDGIRSGTLWLDTDGRHIQAHGGGILWHEGAYYWYGENKAPPAGFQTEEAGRPRRVPMAGVSCYRSTNLLQWTHVGIVLPSVPDDPGHDLHPSRVCERPKVLFNQATRRFVMWWHVDTADYQRARAGIALADRPEGPFVYQRSFRPIDDQTYRDMNLFLDDDGSAYVFYASEGNRTLYISRLSADFTDIQRPVREGVTWRRNFEGKSREAPAPFKHEGRYYVVTSGCTGWAPNEADIAVADDPLGPYTMQGNPCVGPDADKTFLAQSTFVLPMPGGPPGRFIFMADRWNPRNLGDSRYVWLPFSLTAGQPIRIEYRQTWVPEWLASPHSSQTNAR